MGRGLQIIALAGCIALCSCQENADFAARDCRRLDANFTTCMANHQAQTEHDRVLQCMPYSAPSRISGTWARGFEWNAFFEGRELGADDAFREHSTLTYLIPPGIGALPHDAAGKSLSVVSFVEFEGRHPLCDNTSAFRMIIADRMISERIIEARPTHRVAPAAK